MPDRGDPMLPPKGSGESNRNMEKSATLNLEQFEIFLRDTAFENEQDLAELLLERYGMARRETVAHIETGVTRGSINVGELRKLIHPAGILEISDGEILETVYMALQNQRAYIMIGEELYPVTDEISEVMVGAPLSGRYPELTSENKVVTLDGKTFSLKIYKVFNRRGNFRFEYILEPAKKI